MTSAAPVLLAAFFGLAPRAAAAPDGVRLLPSTSSTVRLVVEVPAPRLEPVRAGSPSMRLVVDGYESVSPPGRPALPERVLTVAVPATGTVSVLATGSLRDVRE